MFDCSMKASVCNACLQLLTFLAFVYHLSLRSPKSFLSIKTGPLTRASSLGETFAGFMRTVETSTKIGTVLPPVSMNASLETARCSTLGSSRLAKRRKWPTASALQARKQRSHLWLISFWHLSNFKLDQMSYTLICLNQYGSSFQRFSMQCFKMPTFSMNTLFIRVSKKDPNQPI